MRKLIYLVFFLLIFSFSVFAAKEMCPRDTLLYVDNFENNQGSTLSYSVSLEGSGAKWTTVVPNSFVLADRLSEKLFVYVTPQKEAKKGEYSIDVSVSGGNKVQVFSHDFVINDCSSFSVIDIQGNRETCNGNREEYKVLVRNDGAYKQSFEIKVSGIDVDLSLDKISLDSGKIGEVIFYIDMPKDPGDYSFTVAVKNLDSGETEFVDVDLVVSGCYDFRVNMNQTEYFVCAGDFLKIPMIVNNEGTVSNEFDLKLIDDVSWIGLENLGGIIRSGDSLIFNVLLTPGLNEKGSFNVNLDVIPKEGDLKAQKSFVVRVDKCENAELRNIGDLNVCNVLSQDYVFILKNTGIISNEFKLTLDGEDWIALNESIVSLDAGEEKFIMINISPSLDGVYNYKLHADDVKGKIFLTKDFVVNVLSVQNCFNLSLEGLDTLNVGSNSVATLPITLRSRGVNPGEFVLNLNGEGVNFVQLNPSVVQLKEGESKVVYLYVAPTLESFGEYNLNLDVSFEDNILASKSLLINISSGEQVLSNLSEVNDSLELITGNVVGDSGNDFLLKLWEGIKTYKYFIFSGIILYLLILICIRLEVFKKFVEFFDEDLEEEVPEQEEEKKD